MIYIELGSSGAISPIWKPAIGPNGWGRKPNQGGDGKLTNPDEKKPHSKEVDRD